MRQASRSHPSTGYLYIILAAVLWGTTGTSQALAPTGANPLSIGAFRLLIGSLCLLILARSNKGFRSRTKWQWTMVLVSGFTIAAYQVSFFAAVKLASVAIGTIVGIGSAPIFGALLGSIFEGEKLSLRWFITTVISISGVILLGLAGSQCLHFDFLGVILALAAGLSYAIYTLANKRLLKDHLPDEVMAVTFSLGAVFLLPLLFTSPLAWAVTPKGLLIILHLGVLATGLSYALFGRGLRSVPVATTTTLTLAEPLTAALLGIFVLKEHLITSAFIGILLIFIGLVVLVWRNPRVQLPE
jgi:DME family drug/metabolite transporter